MPYIAKIYSANTLVRRIYNGPNLIKEVYAGSTLVYDARPKPVSGLTGAAGNGVTLSWSNQSVVATQIEIYRGSLTADRFFYALIDTINITNEYVDSSVSSGSYRYKVVAKNEAGSLYDLGPTVDVSIISLAVIPQNTGFYAPVSPNTQIYLTLSSPNNWERVGIVWNSGAEGWLDTTPNSGGTTEGTTLTYTCTQSITSYRMATVTYRDTATSQTVDVIVSIYEES
jgi:hypothetical protein